MPTIDIDLIQIKEKAAVCLFSDAPMRFRHVLRNGSYFAMVSDPNADWFMASGRTLKAARVEAKAMVARLADWFAE